MFEPVPIATLGAKQPLEAPALHVWWWPDVLQPALPRRARTDAILRTLLARYLPQAADELRFARERHGRPYLVQPDAPDFNLSDTTGGTVVAIARPGRVGIDIERVERAPPVQRLAARWFAPGEAETLAALDPDPARRAFLAHWTAKEAACKATGTGIFGFLPRWRFEADPHFEAPRLVAAPDDAGDAARWTFHRLAPTGEHSVVVACRDLAIEPRCFAVSV